MKTLITALLTALLLTGCAALDRAVDVSNAVLDVPQARSDLEAYLTPDELAGLADELALLDRTYQPLADVIYRQTDITLDAALNQAFGVAVRKQELGKAFAEVTRVARKHRDASKDPVTGQAQDPIPATVSQFHADATNLWDAWDDIAASNQRGIAYLSLVTRLAVPL